MQLSLSGRKYDFLRGSCLRTISDIHADFFPDALVITEAEGLWRGRIYEIGDTSELAARYNLDLGALPRFEGLLLPAFHDTHFHWVQDDVREMPKASLIEWLQKYTFPAESRFADPDYAKAKAEQFWSRILGVGTIGGLCYSSVHDVALDAALACAPEDFRVGNVLMTMNTPDFLIQTKAEAIRSVSEAAARYGARYVSSPRFAPTTHPEVMQAAAEAAVRHGCFQQTHLCETPQEIEWVLGIYRGLPGYEDVRSYTEIYHRVGMLGPRSVFGHCLHMTDAEWELMAASGSCIASCPTSNAPIEDLGLGSGLFDFREAERRGVPWSLASDIGGGPYLSMFDVMHSFVAQNQRAGVSEATYIKALHRSTRKGAELMGLPADRGWLCVGAYLDAIRVPVRPELLATGDPEAILAGINGGFDSREETDNFVLETYIKGASCFRRDSVREV
ncbi:amidohydrolase family protein [Coraliomargarita parva]|uniref:amidohydrolase family protein n=1 Tax=Coraliomargarita parva TaxID=3014050 RepID=UPI0022B4E6E8|nr:amidohydrolase family protein [Coraliomargarita parva]